MDNKTKVYFMGKWISLNSLVGKLKKLGFKEGVDFGTAEIEYKGFPSISKDSKVGGGKE